MKDIRAAMIWLVDNVDEAADVDEAIDRAIAMIEDDEYAQNTYRVSLTMTLDSGDEEGALVTFMELLQSWIDCGTFSAEDLEITQVDAEAQYE